MASITVASTFLASSSASAMSKRHIPASRRVLSVVAKASTRAIEVPAEAEKSSRGRRELVFAATAAAAAALTRVAVAEDEPRAGTAEAKKKYNPVCVTMPTARVCHN
ncbi:photosystem II 5 kDa protein, chloroplastic-like [Punica granatum]|nr:photosystem II 5 kDa protein, chloroplastic-like [Punica granatum]